MTAERRHPVADGPVTAGGQARPSSLEDPELQMLWEVVRLRLERTGPEDRGRVRTPALTSRGRHLLGGLLGHPVRATVDLDSLEAALAALGLGPPLSDALGALGHPVSLAVARRRAARQAGQAARAAARREADGWPEPWARDWVDGMIRAGLLSGQEADAAARLVRDSRAVLDRLDRSFGLEIAGALDGALDGGLDGPVDVRLGDTASRVDVAAEILGSSHGLDRGTAVEAAVTRALRHKYPGVEDRELWERAGAHLDVVSAPVLTWGLQGEPGSPLGGLLARARALGVPLHLSQLALRRHPVVVSPGEDVLVTENPRIVEAAAESGVTRAVVALNGNPSGATRLLLEQLLGCGAIVRYHGDFDAAGLGICARMHRLGLRPWRMGTSSYLAALADADATGVPLPIDPQPAPPTPWTPDLQGVFDRERRVVHEERLINELLGPA